MTSGQFSTLPQSSLNEFWAREEIHLINLTCICGWTSHLSVLLVISGSVPEFKHQFCTQSCFCFCFFPNAALPEDLKISMTPIRGLVSCIHRFLQMLRILLCYVLKNEMLTAYTILLWETFSNFFSLQSHFSQHWWSSLNFCLILSSEELWAPLMKAQPLGACEWVPLPLLTPEWNSGNPQLGKGHCVPHVNLPIWLDLSQTYQLWTNLPTKT